MQSVKSSFSCRRLPANFNVKLSQWAGIWKIYRNSNRGVVVRNFTRIFLLVHVRSHIIIIILNVPATFLADEIFRLLNNFSPL